MKLLALLRNKKNISFFLPCALLVCACLYLVAGYGGVQAQSNSSAPVTEQADAKWIRMGGMWNIKDGRAVESRGAPVIWDYHELMNYNSLVSLPDKNESSFTEMSAKFSLSSVKSNVVEAILAFAMQSPYMRYYYNFFAVRFSLSRDGVQTVSLVRSKRLDDTLPYNVKKNYTIETLFIADCSIEFDRDCEVKIVKSSGAWHEIFREKCDTVTLYIDGKKIFDAKLPAYDVKGNFAIGARGACISVDYVTVKNKNAVIFTDDFSENSIYAPTVKAVKQ